MDIRRKKLIKKASIIAVAIFVLAAAICFAVAFKKAADERRRSRYMMELQNFTKASGADEQAYKPDVLEVEIPDKNLDFSEIKKENGDIYAWIYIPGTDVDYPVFQHPDDDAFYLEHNADGSKGLPGCLYTELLNRTSFTDRNTVIYGHNMRNGTMFATLHRFADESFFDENRYIFIYTPYGDYAYKIFAAYTYSDVHLLKGIDISTDEKFGEYLKDVYAARGKNNNFAKDMTVVESDKIVTLSTCTGDDSKRYLVQGVLLDGRGSDAAEQQ